MQGNFSEDKAGKITLDQKSDVSNKNDTSVKRGEKRPHDDDDTAVALPDELKKMFKPLMCELCDVSVSSPLIALTHYKGKSHLKRVNNYMQTKYNITNAIKKKKDQFEPLKCEVCNIELNSKIVYEQHLAGRQHIKNMKRNKTVTPCSKVEEDPTGRFGIGKAFQDETNQPTARVASVNKLYCEICQVSTHTEEEMTIHKNGKKHKKKIAVKGVGSNGSKTKVSEDYYYSEKDVWEASPTERNDSKELLAVQICCDQFKSNIFPIRYTKQLEYTHEDNLSSKADVRGRIISKKLMKTGKKWTCSPRSRWNTFRGKYHGSSYLV